MAINKGFIKDYAGNTLLPITRGELVLDEDGNIALTSEHFLAGGNNKYGLVTAAERAMLLGSGNLGNGISDIYDKLSYINEGLKIGENTVSFYDNTGKATPIKIGGADNLIVVGVLNDNNIAISLKQVNQTDVSVNSSILRGITVDSYGRVTAVSSGSLANGDLPATLSEKELDRCITNTVGTSDNSIVNKKYVDDKVSGISGIATGALKFGGTISDESDMASKTGNKYYYYKAVGNFLISETLSSDSTLKNVKVGDTLIVDENNKFVHIPSGDDITTLTVTKTTYDVDENAFVTTDVISKQLGDINLTFSDIFTVNKIADPNNVLISIPKASDSTNGYLSIDDYKKLNSLQNVKYSESGLVGNYTIGTLIIGDTPFELKGKDTTYNLELIDKETDAEGNELVRPILQFKENDTTIKSISYIGSSGIQINKDLDSDAILFSLSFTIDGTDYLTFDPNTAKFTVKVGKIDESGTIEGITPYSVFTSLARTVAYLTETITTSLSNTELDSDTKYFYGSNKLKAAIAIEI